MWIFRQLGDAATAAGASCSVSEFLRVPALQFGLPSPTQPPLIFGGSIEHQFVSLRLCGYAGGSPPRASRKRLSRAATFRAGQAGTADSQRMSTSKGMRNSMRAESRVARLRRCVSTFPLVCFSSEAIRFSKNVCSRG
jgi:hypothetical protein